MGDEFRQLEEVNHAIPSVVCMLYTTDCVLSWIN